MKNKYILLTAFSIATLAVGCKPIDSQPAAGDPATPQLEQVKKETKEAVQAANNYAYAQKDEYVAKMKAEIAELNQQMDQLAAKVESSSTATKDEAKAKLQGLREKTAALDKQLDNVKDATGSSWEDVKAGFSKGYDEVKDSFNQARQWLSEKIAP